MNIGIVGSGNVGQTVGRRLAALGHAVVLGTRNPARLDEARPMAAPLRAWLAEAGPAARVGTFADAAAHGELVINATAGAATLDALPLAGEAHLGGKPLADISNPLDFSRGFPPTLSVQNTDSLGEQIQRAFPSTRVVKTLNTMSASVMVDPGGLAGGDHTVFLSGNDADAKAQVAALLRTLGWRDILDLGDITTARGTEMFVALWVRLYGMLGSAAFNVRVTR